MSVMLWLRAVLLAGLLSAGLLVAGDGAFAQGDEAKSVSGLIERGRELRRKGAAEEALKLFTDAHARRPSALTFTQMALTEQLLQRWVTAEEHFVAALAYPSDDPFLKETDASGRTNRDFAEASLKAVRTHIGQLAVKGDPGTEILLPSEESPREYRSRGRLPLKPLRLREGPVQVRAVVGSGTPVHLTAVIVPDSTAEIVVPSSAPSKPDETPARSKLGEASSGPAQSEVTRAETQRLDGLNQEFWTKRRKWMVGAGGVLLVAGGILWALNERPACKAPCKHRLETEGWALGAALSGAGLLGVGLFVGPSMPEPKSTASVGVMFSGRW